MGDGRRARLIWPVDNRHDERFYLSTGQRQLLMFLRGQLRHGKHIHTVDKLAEVAGIHRSNVSRGLDRLAQLELIGRRSTRGPLGRTIVWRLRHHSRRRGCFRANVATTYRYAGYLTRERWAAEASAGVDRAVRRRAPPRMLYGRCAAGHSVRLSGEFLSRRPSTSPEIVRFLEGRWSGRCRRDGEIVVEVARIPIPAQERPAAGWSRVGDFGLVRGEDGRYTVANRVSGGVP